MNKLLINRPILLLGLLFLFFSGLFIICNNLFAASLFSLPVVLTGNFILFAATVVSFAFYRKSLDNNKGAYIVRMMYSAMLAKMFICLIAITCYIMVKRSAVDKPGIIICFGLYLIYTFAELSVLMKMSKAQKNVKAGSTP
jgi:hypothetical protein